MANPVTTDDIAARWRPLSAAETTQAAALLEDAWALLTYNVPDLEAQLAATPATITPEVVRVVECRMVLRVLKNPDGMASEQIDDYKFTRDSTRSSGDLFLTDDDLLLLTPGTASGAFTIRPSYVPDDLASMAAWRATQP